MLAFIICGMSATISTGVILYVWVIIPCGWIVGAALSTPWSRSAVRHALATAARNRYVWLLTAGLVFATVAATVAIVVAR